MARILTRVDASETGRLALLKAQIMAWHKSRFCPRPYKEPIHRPLVRYDVDYDLVTTKQEIVSFD
jgi:hypothetical protein